MDHRDAEHGPLSERGDSPKDVARLYSWARVKDAPYRAFSRQRKAGIHPFPLSELHDKPVAPLIEPPELSDQAGAPSAESPTTAVSVSLESLSADPRAQPLCPYSFRRPHPPNRVARAKTLSRCGGSTRRDSCWLIGWRVGKTTITANLGCVFVSLGERVLLVEASGSGLLPFYFGASDLRPDLRTFWEPGANYPLMRVMVAEDITREWLENDVKAAMQTIQRTVFDLGQALAAILTEVLRNCAVLSVPLLTVLNSILTTSRIESFLRAIRPREVDIPLPFYISNKFDEQSPRDRPGRELILRQVGDRLLPMTIRRSPDVAEAIGERMTVSDQSPESDIAQGSFERMLWLRKTAPVPKVAKSPGKWSER